MIIGIDDTDSKDGMCTTYLTAVLINRLNSLGTLRGMPHLIRLNPNIQYKTRGNAALALEIDASYGSEERIINITESLVEEMADLECEHTNPGIVFLTGNRKDDSGFLREMEEFMCMAMRNVLALDAALSIIDKYGLVYKGFKNRRGLIGALAACGAILCGLPDYTYELIAYRRPEKFGTLRSIDSESVFRADMETYPMTWDTVDLSNNTIVFAPHSPDPVLFGIRGDEINAIQQAFDIIQSEPIDQTLLYKTNQGTDLHLLDAEINDICEESSYVITGIVTNEPKMMQGGHMFFSLEGCVRLNCAAFEPTKNFRHIVGKLIPGDKVRVYGSIKKGTLNIEKMDILELASNEISVNPLCPSCGKRMKSAGRTQGFRCKVCSTKNNDVVKINLERKIKPGIYEVPPCARRHIAKPLIRSAHPRAFPSR